jgi:hypothetical protein
MPWLHGCTIAHQVLEVMVCKRLAELGRDVPRADVVESLAAVNHDSVGLGGVTLEPMGSFSERIPSSWKRLTEHQPDAHT